ncbi:MAG: hypothetical protein LBV47_03230 [Bacteroidales bacterium]|jgi:acetolactate synthase small subunit|nr:hypothetical protein [Bacteroidales bacterium]
MNKVQSSYFNMAKSVIAVFRSYTVWEGIMLIEAGVNSVGKLIIQINEEIVKQQQNETPGYTAEKYRRRTTLEDRLFGVAVKLNVYAQQTNNDILAAQVTLTRSDISKKALNNLLGLARNVNAYALELLPVLENFQITKADIDELQAAILETEETSSIRDAIRSERVGNTEQLSALIEKIRKELKLMDTQVEAFIKDEEFVRTYFAARRVHDVRSNTRNKPENGITEIEISD